MMTSQKHDGGRRLLDAGSERDTTAVTRRGYAICTQPRSGSNLFCQYLSSTDRLGYPLEYFNGTARRALGIPDYRDDPHWQIEFILGRAATRNGIYAVKLFAHQHDIVSPTIRWTQCLPGLKFVYHERRDLLGQALSWVRSTQTNQYRSTMLVRGEPFYDGAAIRERLMMIARERARWEAFFARTGIVPLRTAYEDLVADPGREVDRVAALLSLPEPVAIDPARVDLAVQRDALTEEWRTRFHRDHGDPGDLDAV
jgi:LPS sulfotransferase NodH